MGAMTSQITSLTIVYSIVYSGADQRKHQSSASTVNSPHKWPVTRKYFLLMTSSCELATHPEGLTTHSQIMLSVAQSAHWNNVALSAWNIPRTNTNWNETSAWKTCPHEIPCCQCYQAYGVVKFELWNGLFLNQKYIFQRVTHDW